MGNKCCSKRQDADLPPMYPGIKSPGSDGKKLSRPVEPTIQIEHHRDFTERTDNATGRNINIAQNCEVEKVPKGKKFEKTLKAIETDRSTLQKKLKERLPPHSLPVTVNTASTSERVKEVDVTDNKPAQGLNSGPRYTTGPPDSRHNGGIDIIRPYPHNKAPVLPVSTPTRPNNHNRRIVIAIYDYNTREDTDLSFRKGDRMEVIDDTSNTEWWRVINLTTKQTGLIPWNYVAEERSDASYDWFFETCTRKEADKLLLTGEHLRGTFLIRPSEHNPNGYSLSVKDWEKNRGFHVKHYKIKPMEDGRYFISTNQTFDTLAELVVAYSKDALGLCHVLAKPCPKPQPQMWDLGPEFQDRWEIDRSEIQLLRLLGKGNFGEVYYGKWKHKTEVAVKTLREGTMSTQAFLQEAAIMKKFRHNKLVALYAVCSTEEPIYIIQEFMNRGSLLDFLRKDEGKTLMFEDLVYIAAQVGSGMKYLESKLLIHRDLAARNVLISDNGVGNIIAKICDFGLARVIEDNEYCPKQGSRFPVKWTAPEAIIYGKFSIKSDVWSYGILLYELFTYGQVPYPGMHGRDVIEQIEHGYRMRKPVSHQIPDDIYKVMTNCWDATPEKRPTFDFLTHYFEAFNITSEVPYREPNAE